MSTQVDERDNEQLRWILEWCKKIEGYKVTFGDSFEAFDANEVYRDLCSFAFVQIGESAGKLSDGFKSGNQVIPWHAVIGLRNYLVHGYAMSDASIVWRTIEDNLPELKEFCEQQLSK